MVAKTRPLIGLTAYEEQARWGVWDLPAVLLPSAYTESVLAAGGIPVVLPALPDLAAATLARLDGLILAGGSDIDPTRYGAEPLETTGPPRVSRDAAEIELVTVASRIGLPVLGICRGLEVMNIARGGTLLQHLPDALGTADHAPAPAVFGRHSVTITAGSVLAGVLGVTGTELSEVASYHHQAVDRLGSGLSVSAVAPDGTIEAIEDASAGFFLGIQWHPEVQADKSLFKALVGAAIIAASAR
jgi:putative glutamine amidotransferase